MSLPAVILCDSETAALRIAGLPVLDRLIVAAHRAGAAPIMVVSPEPSPSLPRTEALEIAFRWCASMPEMSGPTLVLSTRLLVQAVDLKALMENRARLVARDGTLLSAGVVCAPLAANLEEQLSRLPNLVAQGVAEPIANAASVPVVSRALWSSLTSVRTV